MSRTRLQGLRLRLATIEDARFLLALRNDPETSAASFRTQKISWKEHREWLAGRLRDRKVLGPIFVLWATHAEKATRAGQIRLDLHPNGTSAEVSIALAKRFRGYGLAVPALKRAVTKARLPRVLARVKLGNEASVRTFLRAGFRRVGRRSTPVPHWVFSYNADLS